MAMLLFWLFVLLLILSVLLALAVGTGYLLHAILPAVDLGMATLIGLIGIGSALHFVVKLFGMVEERV